jgi:hypothetical protein
MCVGLNEQHTLCAALGLNFKWEISECDLISQTFLLSVKQITLFNNY